MSIEGESKRKRTGKCVRNDKNMDMKDNKRFLFSVRSAHEERH